MKNELTRSLFNDDENINKFEPEYIDQRINCCDIDSELFQRTPDDNDRPLLQKYFERLPKDENGESIFVLFYAFVYVGEKRDHNKNKSVIINVVNEFGELMAGHLNEFKGIFKEYRGEFVEFEAKVIKYRSKNKYGLFIKEDSVRTVQLKPLRQSFSPWSLLGYPNSRINIQETINHYLTRGDLYHQLTIHESEKVLDIMSEKMFGVPGMIYPLVLSMYLMRDNAIIEPELIYEQHKHINILCTMVIDYIIWSRPTTFLEMLKLITYIVLNYIGGCVDNPRDMKYSNCLKDTIIKLDVKVEHVAYHINNTIKNCGGLKAISDSIKDEFKLDPNSVVMYSRQCFAQRILKDVPEDVVKYLVNLKGIV